MGYSKNGYKRNSEDVNNDWNIINSSNITMKDVDFPVFGMDNLGNSELMTPGGEYKFPGSTVLEIPMVQNGKEITKQFSKLNKYLKESDVNIEGNPLEKLENYFTKKVDHNIDEGYQYAHELLETKYKDQYIDQWNNMSKKEQEEWKNSEAGAWAIKNMEGEGIPWKEQSDAENYWTSWMLDNTLWDDYNHAIQSYLLAQNVGPGMAKLYSGAHELNNLYEGMSFGNTPETIGDSGTDMRNNLMGIKAFKEGLSIEEFMEQLTNEGAYREHYSGPYEDRTWKDVFKDMFQPVKLKHEGGEDLSSSVPVNLSILPNNIVDRSFYNPHPLVNEIVLNESGASDDGSTLAHEMWHVRQRNKGEMFENPYVQTHPVGPVTNETVRDAYNRRDIEHQLLVDEFKNNQVPTTYMNFTYPEDEYNQPMPGYYDPSHPMYRKTPQTFSDSRMIDFIPNKVIEDKLEGYMYTDPTTAEGEAKGFESHFMNMPSYLQKANELLLNTLLKKEFGGDRTTALRNFMYDDKRDKAFAQNGEETETNFQLNDDQIELFKRINEKQKKEKEQNNEEENIIETFDPQVDIITENDFNPGVVRHDNIGNLSPRIQNLNPNINYVPGEYTGPPIGGPTFDERGFLERMQDFQNTDDPNLNWVERNLLKAYGYTGELVSRSGSNFIDLLTIPSKTIAETTEAITGKGDGTFNFLDALPSMEGEWGFKTAAGNDSKTFSSVLDPEGNWPFAARLLADLGTDPLTYTGIGAISKLNKVDDLAKIGDDLANVSNQTKLLNSPIVYADDATTSVTSKFPKTKKELYSEKFLSKQPHFKGQAPWLGNLEYDRLPASFQKIIDDSRAINKKALNSEYSKAINSLNSSEGRLRLSEYFKQQMVNKDLPFGGFYQTVDQIPVAMVDDAVENWLKSMKNIEVTTDVASGAQGSAGFATRNVDGFPVVTPKLNINPDVHPIALPGLVNHELGHHVQGIGAFMDMKKFDPKMFESLVDLKKFKINNAVRNADGTLTNIGEEQFIRKINSIGDMNPYHSGNLGYSTYGPIDDFLSKNLKLMDDAEVSMIQGNPTEYIYGINSPTSRVRNYSQINPRGSLNYFKVGSQGKEKMPYLTELRSDMLSQGIIKNRYDKIDDAMLQNYFGKYANKRGPLASNQNPYFGDVRILDFMSTKGSNYMNNLQTLKHGLNILPATAPLSLPLLNFDTSGGSSVQKYGAEKIANEGIEINNENPNMTSGPLTLSQHNNAISTTSPIPYSSPYPLPIVSPDLITNPELTLTVDERKKILDWVNELHEEKKEKKLVSVDEVTNELDGIDQELNGSNIVTDTATELDLLNDEVDVQLDQIKNGTNNLAEHTELLSTDKPLWNNQLKNDLYFQIDNTGGLGQSLYLNENLQNTIDDPNFNYALTSGNKIQSGTDVSEFTDIPVEETVIAKLHRDNLVKNLQVKEKEKANVAITDLETQYMGQYFGGKNFDGDYSIEDAESVKKIQQDVTDAGLGYMLGTYGPNKDGVDGKYGPKTKQAVRQMLSNQVNAIGDYNFTPFWDPVKDGYIFNNSNQCDAEGCADMVTSDYRETGIDVEAIGMSGNNAWNMYDSLHNNGSITKYNIFEEMNVPESVEDARSLMFDAVKNNPIYVGPTTEDAQSPLNKGDIVGIFFPGSGSQQMAIDEAGGLGARLGSNPTYNSHVGYVVGYDTDGTPLIKHQTAKDDPNTEAIEGRSIIHRADQLNVNGVNSYVTWAVEPPKFNVNATFDDSNITPVIEQNEMDLLTSNYISNTEKKVEREFTQEEKDVLTFQYETITNSIGTIAEELGIVAPYDLIRDAQLAIGTVETGIAGSSIPDQQHIDNVIGKDRLINTESLDIPFPGDDITIPYPSVGNLNDFWDKAFMQGGNILGKEPYHADATDVSRGLYKTKLSQTSPLYLNYYGLNENNIDKIYNQDGSFNEKNTKASLYHQTSSLLRSYDMFNTVKENFNSKFPNDPLTEEDVLNLMILSHNQGPDILTQFTQTGRTHGKKDELGNYIHKPFDWEIEAGVVDGSLWDAEDYVYNLRRLYRGNVNDPSSTTWDNFNKVVPGAGDLLYEIENPTGHESYISKVKRYMNNKNVPWTSQEILAYQQDLIQKRDEIFTKSKLEYTQGLNRYKDKESFIDDFIDNAMIKGSNRSRVELLALAEKEYSIVNNLNNKIEELNSIAKNLNESEENVIQETAPKIEDEATASRKVGGEISNKKLFPEWDTLEKDLAMYKSGKEISAESKIKLANLGFEMKERNKYDNYPTDMVVGAINLKNFKPGGDVTLQKQVDIYQDYINGKLKGTKADMVYDKLNRFYYYAAKGTEMSILDYMKQKMKQS